MTKGVSAAKDVATIEVPANHQVILRPATKYSSILPVARFEKYNPIPKVIKKNKPITAQSHSASGVRTSILC